MNDSISDTATPAAAEAEAPAAAGSKPLTDVAFSSFDLHPALLAGLEAAGFTRCTPIQALTLPIALSGRDVAGQAQTGTGKTLAFLVALINRLLQQPALADRKPEDPRALILAPTRELAIQIHKDAVKFGSDLGLKFALVYGGVDYDKQRELLQKGVDVIIATPGRLIDYVKQHRVVSLHACEVCVLDEADRMFDLGFIKDIRFLLRRMPACTTRQTLLFSATLSHRVLELAYEHMNEPEKLVVETDSVTADRVRQVLYLPANEEKIPLLIGLLSRRDAARTMVFVNTKVWVEKVARALDRAGFRVGVLSGDVPQKKRESLLAKFQRGELEALVATDVAARGLHIDGVSHVFNFDLPFDAEDYVHRIGRTARLGAEGDAISFACELYAMSLPDIEAYIGQSIPRAQVTAELLTAIPRPGRAPSQAGDGGADDDSIQTIFRDVREAQRAEREKKGGGPRRDGGSRSGPGGGRREGGPRGESRGPRPERAPRAEGDGQAAAASAPAAPAQGAAAEGIAAPAAAPRAPRPPRPEGAEGAPGEGGEAKRRRRRGGRNRRREGGEGEGAPRADGSPRPPRAERAPGERGAGQPAGERGPRREGAPAPAQPAAPAAKPGLFGRIAAGLRSLVGGDKA